MKNKKLVSFTLNPICIKMFKDYAQIKSINKSALIERLITEEIIKDTEQYLFRTEDELAPIVVTFLKKYIRNKNGTPFVPEKNKK